MKDAYGDPIFTRLPRESKPVDSFTSILESKIPAMQEQRAWFRGTQAKADVPEALQKLKKRFR